MLSHGLQLSLCSRSFSFQYPSRSQPPSLCTFPCLPGLILSPWDASSMLFLLEIPSPQSPGSGHTMWPLEYSVSTYCSEYTVCIWPWLDFSRYYKAQVCLAFFYVPSMWHKSSSQDRVIRTKSDHEVAKILHDREKCCVIPMTLRDLNVSSPLGTLGNKS